MSKSARIPRSSRPDKRPGLSRIPAVVIMLSAAFLLAVLGIFWGLSFTSRPPDIVQEDWSRRKHHHKPKSVMSSQVRQLASLVDFHRLWNTFLVPMLIERYPGSEGIELVRQHIQDQVESLSAGWSLEMDTFEERTPHGVRTFTNLVATLAPTARRRLVLACHYDSKYYPPDGAGRVYVGATDSAVPCAILLEIVHALDKELLRLKERAPDLTLQLLFLDGEEALVSWTATDSLYGSRHLAERMVKTRHPHTSSSTTLIDSLDLFVLLDLLGVSKPIFLNHFSNTAHWFNRLVGIERRLHRLGLLTHHPVEVTYFAGDTRYAPIEDDHLPFLRKGVPILHLISTPFPWVWHTMDDSVENLHPPTIENLVKIVTIFVVEYLGL